jgi:hypothetical protein
MTSMRTRFLVAGLFALAACGDNGGNNTPDARPRPDARIGPDAPDQPDADMTPDGPVADADMTPDGAVADADTTPDAATPDADTTPDAPTADAPPAIADHLLITEVRTVGGDEFVEIYNPTGATVTLTNYYLSDNQNYWQLPGQIAGNTTITVDSSDFLERFPAGATIAAGQAIVVVSDATLFEPIYPGFTGEYTLQETTASSIAMLNTVPSSGTQNPGLTNAGEMVALFFWDGTSDTVKDVDLVVAGNAPTAANTFVAKAPVDGPDADVLPTTYLVDTLTIQDMASDTSSTVTDLQSYKRIALEGLNELAVGGNGITGHDETSEQSRTTWDSNAGSTYTAATPGVVPAF